MWHNPTATDTEPDTPLNPAACVERYDPDVNYFPDQTSITYANGWTIDYFNHYKVISVLISWQDAEAAFQYVLVQCGTPIPEALLTRR